MWVTLTNGFGGFDRPRTFSCRHSQLCATNYSADAFASSLCLSEKSSDRNIPATYQGREHSRPHRYSALSHHWVQERTTTATGTRGVPDFSRWSPLTTSSSNINVNNADQTSLDNNTNIASYFALFAPLRFCFTGRYRTLKCHTAIMGVQPQGKKKTASKTASRPKLGELEKDVRKMRASLKGFIVSDDDYTGDDETPPTTGKKASRSSKASAQQPRQPYKVDTESDDDEEIPLKLEKTMAASAAKEGDKTASKEGPETTSGQKRKRTADTSPSADLFDGLVRPINRRTEREANHSAAQPTRSKRARVHVLSDSEEEIDEAPLTPPRTKRRAPPYVPLPDHPLPRPQWTMPAAKPSTTFTLPAFSLRMDDARPATAVKTTSSSQPEQRNQKQGPTKRRSKVEEAKARDPSPPTEPSYTEIEEFEFKLIVSFSDRSGTENEYYDSSDLVGNMKAFWSLLKKHREEWEDAAGAEWAWELQKTQKSRGKQQGAKRFCVSSKVAKKPTLWRKGDSGNFACRKCAANSLLCFTWVADEGAKYEEDDSVVPEPKGEFWCLPVHPEDRRCVVTKDREIRTWLNEGDNSESDSSGEDDGVSSEEEDDYKVESDFDQLSLSEPSELSEEDESTDNEGL